MNPTLRDTLRDLPPEPPAGLGLHTTALRRAGRLRRRRAALAGTAAVAAAAAVFAGAAVLPGSGRAVAPAASSPLVGSFPGWPRRGDGDPARDAQAVAHWRSLVERQAAIFGTPRVLYSGGGERPVVVLVGTAYPGGDRLVVVTFPAGEPVVLYDRAAPLPGSAALALLLDRPPAPPAGTVPCDVALGDDPAYATRLLVLTAPGVRGVRSKHLAPPLDRCEALNATREWVSMPVRGGAALADVPLHAEGQLRVEARARDGWVRADGAGSVPAPTSYPRLERVRNEAATPAGWDTRIDSSRAYAVAVRLEEEAVPGVVNGHPCRTLFARSLPDGTAVVLCVAEPVGSDDPKERRVAFVADDARGRFRVYHHPQGLTDAYTAVVEGRTGRWLVIVGRPEITSAALLDGASRREIPLEHGTGFLLLADGEARGPASITTSDYGPDGGFALSIVEGREIRSR